MSTLTVGRLVGYIDLDESGLKRGTKAADQDMQTLRRSTAKQLDAIKQDFAKAGQEAGERLGNGLTVGADGVIRGNINTLAKTGEKAGKAAGEGIADGAEKGAKDLADAADAPMRKMSGKLKSGAAVAGLAAGAALTKGFTDSLDIEVATDKVAASLLLTEEQSQVAGEVAGALYADAYGESMGDVTEAVAAVMSSITGMREASEADLQRVTGKALDFATAFEVDVARAVQSAGTLIGSGLARDADHAFDLITVASAKVPKHLREDLLDASDEYAQFFRTLGYSGDQAFDLLVKASAKGMYGIDKAGDSIKEFTLLATDIGAKPVLDAYKAVGLNAHQMSNAILGGGDAAYKATRRIIAGLADIEDPSEQAAAAIALFGTPLEDMNKADIPEFLRMMARAGAGMDDVAGSAERMGTTLNDNAKTSFTAWHRSLKANVTDYLSNEAVPAFRKLIDSADFQKIVDKAKELGAELKGLWDTVVADAREWAEEHKEEIRAFVETAGEYFADFMDLAKEAVAFFKAIWDAGGKETLTVVLIALTMLVNTIRGFLEIITGILQVATALMTGDWERFWKGIDNITAGFKRIVGGAIQAFVNLVKLNWQTMIDAMLAAVELILKGAAKAFGWLPGIGPKLQQAARDFEQFRDSVNNSLAGIRNTIPINFVGSASGVAPRVVLGGMQHYSRGGSIGPGEIGRVAEDEPELLSTAGKSYLLMSGQPGYITPASQLALSGGGGASTAPVRVDVRVDASGLRGVDRAIVEGLQFYVHHSSGGDVQKALGRRGRFG